jgi:uncharacterized membrane-anchored protein YitT (DUF2179 family)
MKLLDTQRIGFARYLMIASGTVLFAFGLYMFVIPYEFMEGGLTGIALLLHYIFEFPTSISTITINLPLFYLGWKIWGRQQFWWTVYGTLCLAGSLHGMEWLIAHQWIHPSTFLVPTWLAAGYAGVCSGVGLGIVFRYGATTGGSDILASLFRKCTGWRMGRILFAMDFIILSFSLFFIPYERILISLFVVYIASRMIDKLSQHKKTYLES